MKTAEQIMLANLEADLAILKARYAAVPNLANLRRIQLVKQEMESLLVSMPTDDVVSMMRR